MAGTDSRSLDRLPRRPIAVSAAALFTLASPTIAAAANIWTVNTCDQGNSGDLPSRAGTLRFAVENAASGDTVDLSTLACGKISLSTGSIRVTQDDLTVVGPGRSQLTISGKFSKANTTYSDKDRIIHHSGVGTLSLYGLTLSDGYLSRGTGSAKGGCLYSRGGVYLYDVAVIDCLAKVTTGSARGGGLYVTGDLVSFYSTIAANTAAAGTGGSAAGGGVLSKGSFTATYVTIDGNTAKGAANQLVGVAGGVLVGLDATLASSTVSNNVAGRNGAGVDVFSATPAARTTIIVDSTIAGNSAGYLVGGVYANSGHVTIENATIAFNNATARNHGYSTAYFGAGVALSALYGSVSAILQSSLISNNLVKNKEWDLTTPYASPPTKTVAFNAAPANNIVRHADPATQDLLPADTSTACPLLGSLRNNGGPVETIALQSTSPAIDAGNTVSGVVVDERGAARVSGTAADIGAYEVQQADVVFNAAFDGCVAL